MQSQGLVRRLWKVAQAGGGEAAPTLEALDAKKPADELVDALSHAVENERSAPAPDTVARVHRALRELMSEAELPAAMEGLAARLKKKWPDAVAERMLESTLNKFVEALRRPEASNSEHLLPFEFEQLARRQDLARERREHLEKCRLCQAQLQAGKG